MVVTIMTCSGSYQMVMNGEKVIDQFPFGIMDSEFSGIVDSVNKDLPGYTFVTLVGAYHVSDKDPQREMDRNSGEHGHYRPVHTVRERDGCRYIRGERMNIDKAVVCFPDDVDIRVDDLVDAFGVKGEDLLGIPSMAVARIISMSDKKYDQKTERFYTDGVIEFKDMFEIRNLPVERLYLQEPEEPCEQCGSK